MRTPNPTRLCTRCYRISPRDEFVATSIYCRRCREEREIQRTKRERRDGKAPKYCRKCNRQKTLADFDLKKNHCRECVAQAKHEPRDRSQQCVDGPRAYKLAVARCPACGRIMLSPKGYTATCNCATIAPTVIEMPRNGKASTLGWAGQLGSVG